MLCRQSTCGSKVLPFFASKACLPSLYTPKGMLNSQKKGGPAASLPVPFSWAPQTVRQPASFLRPVRASPEPAVFIHGASRIYAAGRPGLPYFGCFANRYSFSGNLSRPPAGLSAPCSHLSIGSRYRFCRLTRYSLFSGRDVPT